MGDIFRHSLVATADGNPIIGFLQSGDHVLRDDGNQVHVKEFKLVGQRETTNPTDSVNQSDVFVEVGSRGSTFENFQYRAENKGNLARGGCLGVRDTDVIYTWRLRTSTFLSLLRWMFWYQEAGDRIICSSLPDEQFEIEPGTGSPQ